MKRPSFQFYPGDWQSNSNLRRCTHAEKGAWLDSLCLMHDQPEYGILRWPLSDIAQAIGAPIGLLRGLTAKGVLKGDDRELQEAYIYVPRSGRKDGDPVILLAPQAGPIWYSSRMVRDEYVRTIRGESSRFGAEEDDAPKGAPKPLFGDGSSSSSSSSSSTPPKPPPGVDGRFDRFWQAYPRKVGKDAAAKAFAKRKPDDALLAAMLAAIATQRLSPGWTKDSGQFIPHPSTWLNEGRWQDEVADGASNLMAGAV